MLLAWICVFILRNVYLVLTTYTHSSTLTHTRTRSSPHTHTHTHTNVSKYLGPDGCRNKNLHRCASKIFILPKKTLNFRILKHMDFNFFVSKMYALWHLWSTAISSVCRFQIYTERYISIVVCLPREMEFAIDTSKSVV